MKRSTVRAAFGAALLASSVAVAAGDAHAYRLWLETGQIGGLMPGDTLTVEVHLDTETDTGVTHFSVAVEFPDQILQYDQAGSSAPSYILYAPQSGVNAMTYMVPRHEPGLPGPGNVPGPDMWPLASDQINVDMLTAAPLAFSAGQGTSPDVVLATLRFDVVGTGSGQIGLSLDRDGNTFVESQSSTPTEISPSVTLGSALAVSSTSPAVPVFGGLAVVLLSGTLLLVARRQIALRHVPLVLGGAIVIAALAVTALAPRPGVAQGGGGHAPGDVDDDGVPDASDNCLDVANGPLASFGSCNAQQDADADGYGNPCDTDTNNDGVTALDEVLGYLQLAGMSGTAYDFNCDGVVGIDDYVKLFEDVLTYDLVGPSGLACAGTAPCP